MAAVTGLGMANTPPLLALLAMAIAGMAVGGLWIMLVGALRHYWGVNETISSLLLNYVAIATRASRKYVIKRGHITAKEGKLLI